MKKRIYKVSVTEIVDNGNRYEGCIETEDLLSVLAYLKFYQKKEELEDGDDDVM